jgi:phosphohistidine phosphatase SixA
MVVDLSCGLGGDLIKEEIMYTKLKSTISAIAALVSAFTLLAVVIPRASAQGSSADAEIATALRGGDLVMVVRHGATFPDQADTDPLNFDNIAAQRNLNDKGKALAKAFGEAIRQTGVPVGKVFTSKYNRAYETAVIAGFKDIETTADLTEGGLVVSPNENNRRAEAFRKMIATPPAAHTVTILITHQPNIIAALGRDWFDVKEGEASIFRPVDGGFKLIARVQMDEWPRIATAK